MILGITLSPSFALDKRPNLVPLVGIVKAFRNSPDLAIPVLNLPGNVLLFVPFGFSLSLRWARLGPGRAGIVAVALPAAIETVQGLVLQRHSCVW